MSTEANKSRLENRDYKIVIDKSASMTVKDCAGKTRWAAVQETAEGFARKVETLDPDGITLITFNNKFTTYDNVTADKVSEIFAKEEPSGSTVLAPVLESVFADYLARRKAGNTKANGEMLIVVTDGEAQDADAVTKSIVKFGNQLETGDGEYGISFLQIGQDRAATAFLKNLDDGLVPAGAKHDIVDTKTMDEIGSMSPTDVLIAALDD